MDTYNGHIHNKVIVLAEGYDVMQPTQIGSRLNIEITSDTIKLFPLVNNVFTRVGECNGKKREILEIHSSLQKGHIDHTIWPEALLQFLTIQRAAGQRRF